MQGVKKKGDSLMPHLNMLQKYKLSAGKQNNYGNIKELLSGRRLD